MEHFKDIAGLRSFIRPLKAKGKVVSFVPTMGGLHAGHGACIEIAHECGDVRVVSIFVNPAQFAQGEDLDRYPKRLAEDLRFCEARGCDAVFTPSVDEMYPSGVGVVWVSVESLTDPLCGRSRPGHFRGVATVVAKLFHIVDPDIAVFGQKDAQQALVIRALVRQLNMDVQLRLAPIAREADGLAVSTRNGNLKTSERQRAAGIHRALVAGRDAIAAGERVPATICSTVRAALAVEGIDDVEYVELLDAKSLTELSAVEGKVLLAVAARVGTTRLIDNQVLGLGHGGVCDEMLF